MTWSALKYGSIYFTLVFGTGFALGTIRVFILEPRIGTRYAELTEMPIMLFVIYLSAKYVVSKLYSTKPILPYLVTGLSALTFLLLVEFALVLGLQGMSIEQYLESRDNVAFGAYIISLIIFALMPLIIKVWNNPNDA
jgi:hypothetical protein